MKSQGGMGLPEGMLKRKGRAISGSAFNIAHFSNSFSLFYVFTWHDFTWLDPNRIAPLYGRTIQCLAFEDAFGIPTFETSVPGVEMAYQVSQAISVDILR